MPRSEAPRHQGRSRSRANRRAVPDLGDNVVDPDQAPISAPISGVLRSEESGRGDVWPECRSTVGT
jgi:hypothetical protein